MYLITLQLIDNAYIFVLGPYINMVKYFSTYAKLASKSELLNS